LNAPAVVVNPAFAVIDETQEFEHVPASADTLLIISNLFNV
jgi:hypothetical protein